MRRLPLSVAEEVDVVQIARRSALLGEQQGRITSMVGAVAYKVGDQKTQRPHVLVTGQVAIGDTTIEIEVTQSVTEGLERFVRSSVGGKQLGSRWILRLADRLAPPSRHPRLLGLKDVQHRVGQHPVLVRERRLLAEKWLGSGEDPVVGPAVVRDQRPQVFGSPQDRYPWALQMTAARIARTPTSTMRAIALEDRATR